MGFSWTGLSLQADSNSPEPLTSQEVGSTPCPRPTTSGGRENSCAPEVGGGKDDALMAQSSPLSWHILLECSAARPQSSSPLSLLPAPPSNGSWLSQALRRLGSCHQHFLQFKNKRKPSSESPRTSPTPRVFFASSCCCDCQE